MPIHFDADRWRRVQTTYDSWWKGELQRPVVELTAPNRQPDRPCPPYPVLSQANCTDLSLPVDGLIDRLDWELSRKTFLGDAFPLVNLDIFGPGVVAAFAGAILDNSSGRVWFHPPWPDRPISDMHIQLDPESVWLARVEEICASAMKRWQGQVLVSMTDLGGNLDILQSFMTAERLLMELYDQPDEVVRLLWEAHDTWRECYRRINAVLQPVNPGYSDWSGIYSDRPSYILQCDFSYMIGPKMFRQFVAPELERTCQDLDRSFYHLDGAGQLPHLDQLLAMEDLDGIQWVVGANGGREEDWPEVRRKIAQSGKRTQAFGDLGVLRTLIEQAGTARGMHYRAAWPEVGDEDEARRALAEFGADCC